METNSLRPQILKDLLYVQNGDTGNKLLQSITSLSTQIFNGEIPNEIRPYLFGASLTALQKKMVESDPLHAETHGEELSLKLLVVELLRF